MRKEFKICGIDASTTSTGICIAKCCFDVRPRDKLLDLLISEKPEAEPEDLEKCFVILEEDEIKWSKSHDKALKACRKNQREAVKSGGQPSIVDTHMEELLVILRIQHQVKEIKAKLLTPELKPNVILTEDYSYRSQGSLTQLAELKGVLKISLRAAGLIGEEVKYFNAPIPSVKKIAATNGNANKEQICEHMKRFGFKGYEEKDDQLDAIGIALSMFYAMYYRLHGFKFPLPKNAKERNKQKAWIKCLETFANRIGTKEEFEDWTR